MTELTTGTQIFHVLQSLFLVLVIFFICIAIYNILRRKWNDRHVAPTSRQLVIKESLILDTKRRLVRVQNRHSEHLLLLGSSEDLVIESYSIKQALAPKEHHPLEKN
ncbi:MAG: hypothetical protein ACRYGR_02845 [Janthinobacterium lividum]